ncbi:FimV/HubP family polar landmark protein [Alkalimarinus coralli]|uniref:FimV/HubP family polar landmark protein n=1 Tax=Alkalimarinus coralli TaxID=2935863 RepID=UPI00202B139F|nr:FimV/HubP family polar landmark protein [Alkalimarinus coralli]
MMRKLAVALSLAGVLGAGVVQALGLGEASVESTLNQPLKAEIELVNVRDLEENEILPGLASREEFLNAGVERIYFLSDVRFEVQRNENGKMVVELTTTKPVREPFLNFLVEVIWPSGRLLREYALLIDPPIYGEEPLAPVRQVTSTATPTNQLPEIEVIESSPSSQNVTESIASQPEFSSVSQQGGGTYGPTTNSDTMWAIALKVRPDSSVTPQQTMLAIQDLNPDSFINNNINSLKKGQVLRLPGINEIRQRSKRDAVRGVIAQNRDFEARTLGKNVVDATPKVETPSAAPEVSTGDELKLVVAEKSSAADNQSGAHAGESAIEGSAEALKNDLAVTLEKLDQASLEKEELNSRVKDLEEQLETLQRLLTLKDDQLANLQTQMGKEQIEETEGLAGESQDEKLATADEAEPSAEVEPASEIEAVESSEKDEEVVDSEVVDSEVASEEAKVDDQLSSSELEPSKDAPAAKVETPAVKPKAAPVPVKEEPVQKEMTLQSVVDMVLKNPLYQAIAAGLVILLLLIVWLLSRRNAQREQEFFETRNELGEEPGDIFDVEEPADEDEILPEDGSETAVDEAEAPAQPETEDVIAEADIYIAYGRLDQAAQLLETAISSEPQRTDIRLKLLEVYAESNELESFDKQFNEINALNDDYAIEQATEIKSRLPDAEDIVSIDDLESQLLSGDVESEPEDSKDDMGVIEYEPTKVEEVSDEVLDVDSDLSELESELSIDGAGADSELAEDDLDIDFDINELDLEADETLSEADTAPLDLELDDISIEEPAKDDVAAEVDDLDLDLDFESKDGSLSAEDSLLSEDLDLDISEEGVDISEEGLDIDLDETELTESPDLSLDQELADIDSELDEIDLDIEGSSEVQPEEKSDELALEGGDLDDALNLDDLDLELDKIDSELDVNFEAGDSTTESDELSVDSVEEADAVDETDLDSTLLDVDSTVVEDLEDIADTLAIEGEEDAPLQETDVLASELDIDDSTVDESILDESILDESTLDESTSSDVETPQEIEVDDSVLDIAEEPIAADEKADSGEGFESDLTEDEDFDFLAGTDEAATKLDLARAYIDMGDSDGAKDILEEVALEGSDEQKKEAQDLLKTLD